MRNLFQVQLRQRCKTKPQPRFRLTRCSPVATLFATRPPASFMRRALLLLLIVLGCNASYAADLAVSETTLANGLKLYVVERPQAAEVECRIVYNVGGRTDPAGCTGAAHFCEHLMFKGSTVIGTVDYAKEIDLLKREDDVRAALVLLEEDARTLVESGKAVPDRLLRQIGALRLDAVRIQGELRALSVPSAVNTLYQSKGGTGVNASTSYHMTQYYVTLPPNKLELFFWIESDRLANPVFRQFYEEKEAVVSERNMYVSGTPFGRALEVGGAVLFPESGYGSPILGWPDDITRVTRPQLMAYAHKYYRPDNAAIVLVGAVTASTAKALAEKYFGSIARPSIMLDHRITEPLETIGTRFMRMKVPAVNFGGLAWRVPSGDHPDAAAFEVLAELLGGEESGLLRRNVVEQGHALAAQALMLPLGGESLFVVFGVPTRDRPSVFVDRLRNILAQIKLGGIREDDIERVRKRLVLDHTALLGSNRGIAGALCEGFIEGCKGETLLERHVQATKVSIDDIARVASSYLASKDALVLYGKPRSLFESDPVETSFALEGVPTQIDVVELRALVDNSVRENANRFTALHAAAQARYDELARLAPSRGGVR